MASKTDKRSSLDHVMHYIDRKAEFGKTIPVAKAKRAAQYAFNAGRKSVVENIPRLLFKESQEGLIADNGIFEFIYHIYKSASVDEPRYAFATTYETPIQWYDTLEEAMDASNEDYKKRIKQALGL